MILPDTDLTNERLGNYINHIVEIAFNAGLECNPETTNKYESLNETKNKVLNLTKNVSLMRVLKMNNFGFSGCFLENVNNLPTKPDALLALFFICMMSEKDGSPCLCFCNNKSEKPIIAVNRLLKSCATPPASCPIACIF